MRSNLRQGKLNDDFSHLDPKFYYIFYSLNKSIVDPWTMEGLGVLTPFSQTLMYNFSGPKLKYL